MNTKIKINNRANMTMFYEIAAKRGLDIGEVFLLGVNTLDALGAKTKCPMKKARELIQEGADAMEQKRKTVSFSRAVEELIASKAHRRARTISYIRYLLGVFMRETSGLYKWKLRSITTKKCAEMIKNCFHTQRQRYKARLILHGVFTLALKRGWCSENPVSNVDVPVLKETTIMALNVGECKKLIRTAKYHIKGECLAAVGLMLYAGIRPQEVQRLRWEHINLEQSFISISPNHSKTGGSRHVSIEPVLHNLLKAISPSVKSTQSICPPNWRVKWAYIRKSAEWDPKKNPWGQDCLRHSHASFHALHFKNFSRLQYEMGHRNSNLLLTRYLNMSGLTPTCAETFWATAL